MSDERESDERDHISKNDQEIVTDDIEVFQLGKLSSKKTDDNIEKESDEGNRMDMSDDKDYYERYQIENLESLKRIDSQQNRYNYDLVDTYIKLEKNVVKNTELSTSESVSGKMVETPDENVNT